MSPSTLLSSSASLRSLSLPSPHRYHHYRQNHRNLTVQSKIREIFMPALSSTMTEGKIVSWIKSEGDRLSKGDSVVVVESDKADMDVETFHDGFLAAILVPDGLSAPVGSPIAFLAESEDEIPLAVAKAQSFSPSSPPSSPIPDDQPVNFDAKPLTSSKKTEIAVPIAERKVVVATPYAKKLAKQHKVDVERLVGTGPFGRVTPTDVEKAVGIVVTKKAAEVVKPVVAGSVAVEVPKVGAVLPAVVGGTVAPFTAMQAAVARNMVESLNVPSFRVGYPVITDALDALYEKVKPKGVTMTVLLAKAVAMSLVQHPVINATCKDGKSFTYNDNVNIAVAVAIDGGLITPVLQDADKLDIYLLSQRWKELVAKARAKQLQPSEYNSGTFTLSNLGMFGVDRFDAILPPGQGAIMAVGASKPTVEADENGFFGVKNKMLVNVTADHRIIYGADLAAFLQTFAKIIANPDSLTL